MTGKDLKQTPSSDVADFLEQLRKAPLPSTVARRGRLIFAMDATASRQPSWDSAISVQGQMFLETERLGGLDVQLVYYRGLDECRASRWVSDAGALVSLMTRVMCRAGQTQLRRVLRHARSEAQKRPVQALVFVGDTVEEQADELAGLAGEMALMGVRAFLFQEGSDPAAARVFADIARITGGASCRFDSSSPAELRSLLAAVAAYAAGGTEALRLAHARGSKAANLLLGQVR